MIRMLNEPDNCVVDFFDGFGENKKILVVTFTSLFNRDLNGFGFGGQFLSKSGFSVLAFKSISDDWFQSLNIEIFQYINTKLSSLDYIQRVGYGSSLGATASILFSRILSLDTCICLSPQYEIDNPVDKRWLKYFVNTLWKYRITNDSFSEKTKYYVIYDNYDMDSWHFQKIYNSSRFNNVIGIRLPYSGHSCAEYLSQLNILKDLFLKIVLKEPLDLSFTRRNKSKSTTYLLNIARALETRGRINSALKIANHLLNIDDKNSALHGFKSVLLERLGNLDEAYLSALRGNELDNNPHLLARLSKLSFLNGEIESSLKFIECAISMDGTVEEFHAHKSRCIQLLESKLL